MKRKVLVNGKEIELSREEEALLFVKMLHNNCENYWITFPWKNKYGKMQCCRAQDWIKTSEISEKMFSVLENDIRKENADTYVSINQFSGNKHPQKGYVLRTEAECRCINGILIDIDFEHKNKYDASIGDPILEQVLNRIKSEMPKATSCVLTGRGIALFYRFEAVNNPSKAFIKKHKELSKQIYCKIQNLIDDIDDRIKIDTSVRDISRVCRLPGTFNRKAERYAKLVWLADRITYKPDDLYGAFDLHYDAPQKNEQNKDKKQKQKKTVTMKCQKKRIRRNIKDVYGFKACANYYRKCIVRMLGETEKVYLEGTGRRSIVFGYVNCCLLCGETLENTILLAKSLNDFFQERLSDSEIEGIVYGIYENGAYKIKLDVLCANHLHLTYEDAVKYGFYDNIIAQQKRKAYIEQEIKIDSLICKLAENRALTQDQICEQIEKILHVKISKRKLQYRLKEYNLNRHTRGNQKISKSDIQSKRPWKRKAEQQKNLTDILNELELRFA